MRSKLTVAAGTLFVGGAATAAAPQLWITTLSTTVAALMAFWMIFRNS